MYVVPRLKTIKEFKKIKPSFNFERGFSDQSQIRKYSSSSSNIKNDNLKLTKGYTKNNLGRFGFHNNFSKPIHPLAQYNQTQRRYHSTDPEDIGNLFGSGKVEEGQVKQFENKSKTVTAKALPYKTVMGTSLIKAEGSLGSLQGQKEESGSKRSLKLDILKPSLNIGLGRVKPRLDEFVLKGSKENKKKGKYLDRSSEGEFSFHSGGLPSLLMTGFPYNPTPPKISGAIAKKITSSETGRGAKFSLSTGSVPYASIERIGMSEKHQKYLAHKAELLNNPKHLTAEKEQARQVGDRVLLEDPTADEYFVRQQIHRDFVESAAEKIAREKRNKE